MTSQKGRRMRTSLQTLWFGSLVFTLVALPSSVAPAHAQSRAVAGRVSFLSGGAFRAEKEEGPYRRLTERAEVFEGDFLKTEVDSRIETRLLDESVIRVGPNSRLRVEQAKFKGSGKEQQKTFSARLIIGRAWAKVTKLFGNSTFDVQTPNAVAGVRGTAFGVDTAADKTTTVRVYSGKVLVSNKPVYMTEERKTPDPKTGKPSNDRKQVPGPQEVSKKQWEEAVAGALQQVRVGANGQLGQPEQFAAAEAEKDTWIAWNRERDALLGADE